MIDDVSPCLLNVCVAVGEGLALALEVWLREQLEPTDAVAGQLGHAIHGGG